MPNSIDSAYYFSKTEFLLLLGLAGIEEVYTFELPKKDEVSKKNLILALHHLTRQGQVMTDDHRPVLSEETESLIRGLAHARRLLTVLPKDDFTQKICYFSDEGIILTELAGDPAQIRLSSPTPERLWEQLMLTGMPTVPLETAADGEQLIRHNDMVAERFRQLQQEDTHLEPDFLWEIFAPGSDSDKLCLQFIEDAITSWTIIDQDGDRHVAVDTMEARLQLWKEQILL